MIGIGDSEVKQAQIGENVMYRPIDYKHTWIDCSANGVEGVDFTGINGSEVFSVFQWDPDTKKARFKSNATCTLAAPPTNVDDPTRDRAHLAFSLPEGFIFSDDNPETMDIFALTQSGETAKTLFEGNKLSLVFRNRHLSVSYYNVLAQDVSRNIPLQSELVLNVERKS